MQVLGLIGIFIMVVLLDLPGLLKTNNRAKTMAIYFSLIALGFVLGWLYMSGQAPESPAAIMERMVRFIIPGQYTVQ